MQPDRHERVTGRFSAGIAALAFTVVFGLGLLHLGLGVLWPDRTNLGFGLFRPWTGPAIAIFTLFVIFAIATAIRAYGGPAGVAVRLCITAHRGTADLGGRLLRLLGFYLLIGAGGVLVIVVFNAGTHFSTAPAIASAIIVFVSGLRRGPRPTHRLADGMSLLLLALLYGSFMAYQPLHHWLDGRSTPVATLIDLLFLLAGGLLGWSLLHSRLRVWLRARRKKLWEKVPRAWETPPAPALGRALAEWIGHAAVVAVALVLLRLLYVPLPTLLPYEDSVFFLGVDWYWVRALSLITAAELFLLLALATFGFASALAAWPLSATRTEAAR